MFRLCSRRMHTLFLASNFALFSSILRLCQIAHISSFSLIDSLIFHRMLSTSCSPTSLLRSRNYFSTSVVVRIAPFGLADSCSLMIELPSLLALGHILDLLLSCSEFLFISSNFLAFGVWCVLIWYCICLRRFLRMSVPCVLLSVFTLRSRQLLCPLQLTL